uniref:Uncharacterized protein n=1 Tax=Rhizophora mucronata TaxID=61149 RepID=A0A2P2NU88_RHIMU
MLLSKLEVQVYVLGLSLVETNCSSNLCSLIPFGKTNKNNLCFLK